MTAQSLTVIFEAFVFIILFKPITVTARFDGKLCITAYGELLALELTPPFRDPKKKRKKKTDPRAAVYAVRTVLRHSELSLSLSGNRLACSPALTAALYAIVSAFSVYKASLSGKLTLPDESCESLIELELKIMPITLIAAFIGYKHQRSVRKKRF